MFMKIRLLSIHVHVYVGMRNNNARKINAQINVLTKWFKTGCKRI